MRLLLDTHVFVWADGQSQRLSSQVRSLLKSPENDLFLSLASIWELQIKMQLGKLQLSLPLAEVIATQQQVNRIQILAIDLTHILTLDQLPTYHRDPFDRLLVAQAIAESLILVSNDSTLTEYPASMLG